MLSIIITAKEEPKTVGTAVRAFLNSIKQYNITNNKEENFEIIVVAPDKDTLQEAKRAYRGVKLIQDEYGGGKAAAMNLAIKQARGDKLIFSDGDVEVDKNAIIELLKVNSSVVTGRPIVIKTYKIQMAQKYDYWQECLVDMAHRLRAERDKRNAFLLLTGYLFYLKKDILKDFKLPEYLLTEDEYFSYWLWQQGYKIKYAPLAIVKVKYADNYKDWLKQKIRSLAGAYQIPAKWKKNIAMRSFTREIIDGLKMARDYIKNIKELYWIILLFLARVIAWLLAWWKVKILKQQRSNIWQRVESTK